MKKFLLGTFALMLCAIISSCEKKPLVVEAEGDAPVEGLIGSYVELAKGSYQVDYDDKAGEATVSVKLTSPAAVECKISEVKAALLGADKEELEVLTADAADLQKALTEGKKEFQLTFSTDINEDNFDKLREEAKYIVLKKVEAVVTYRMSGTVAGKNVGCVFEFEGKDIKGGYYYVGIGSSNDPIAITGKYDAKNNGVKLVEVYNGQVTGRWNMKLTPGGGTTLKGDMTNFRGHTYTADLKEDSSVPEMVIPEAETYEADDLYDFGTPSSDSDEGSVDIDEFLDKYEKCVDTLIEMTKDAQNGDPSVLADYAKYLEEVSELSEEAGDIRGNMSAAQLSRLQKILSKYQQVQK